MIDFNCVHCGNPFRVAQEHAGRKGWCKVCKGSVVVPAAASSASSKAESAPPAASTEADLIQLAELRGEVETLKIERHELQSRLESMEPLAARVEELDSECMALNHRLDEVEQEGAEREQALAEREQALAVAIDQVEALQRELDESRAEAERELAESRERLVALEGLKSSLARAEERLSEMDSRAEQMDSDITRELEAAEDLAVETADSLKRLSEVLVAQQTVLERMESEDSNARDSELPTIALTVAPDQEEEGEAVEPTEVVSETVPEHDRAVADAFLHFLAE